MFVGRPPLFLNDAAAADIGELGEPKGGGGNAVNELVMVTICCNGLLFLACGENEIKGEGPGRGVVGGDDGSSDLLSSSLMLCSFSASVSRLKS